MGKDYVYISITVLTVSGSLWIRFEFVQRPNIVACTQCHSSALIHSVWRNIIKQLRFWFASHGISQLVTNSL